MITSQTLVDRVRLLIREVLSIEVLSANTDLMESGLIDSLALVSIIAEIEDEFQVVLALDDLDIDQFRSVQRIAEFLSQTVLAVQ